MKRIAIATALLLAMSASMCFAGTYVSPDSPTKEELEADIQYHKEVMQDVADNPEKYDLNQDGEVSDFEIAMYLRNTGQPQIGGEKYLERAYAQEERAEAGRALKQAEESAEYAESAEDSKNEENEENRTAYNVIKTLLKGIIRAIIR